MIGKQLGNWRVKELFDRGGFAEVYLAHHVSIPELQVAIKRPHAHFTGQERQDFLELLDREAKNLAIIRHPNVVKFVDYFVNNDQAYVVLEFIGDSIRSRINKAPEHKIDRELALNWMDQALLGLGEVHRMNILHRNLKPGSFLIDSNNQIKIASFGLSCNLHETMSPLSQGCYTPGYVSPERLKRNVNYDRRSDIFEMGICLYELLTGSLPFLVTDTYFESLLNDAPPSPRLLVSDLDPRLEAVVLKALSKDPVQRFASCEEFRRALADAQDSPKSEASQAFRMDGGNPAISRLPEGDGVQSAIAKPRFVQKLSIKGYKSIKSLVDFELRPLNVLIGANGAGKSSFMGLFRLLQEMYEEQLQAYLQRQGGPDAFLHFGRTKTQLLEAEIQWDSNEPLLGRLCYRFGLSPTADNRFLFEFEETWLSNPSMTEQRHPFGIGHVESKLKKAEGQQAPFAPAVAAWRVYHFQDTSEHARVKQLQPTNDNLRLKPDAANLAAYLRFLHESYPSGYRRIVEYIRLALPFFDDFVHRPGQPDFVELEWKQKGRPDTPLKAHLLSDGSLRFICLITLLMQPEELLPATLLIDEPELGLHPSALTLLAEAFKQVAESKQLIVSTQSVELINELLPEDVVVVDQEEGISTFHRHSEEELRNWLEEYSMGELWKRNILGGRP